MKHITKLFTRLATIAALGFLTAATAWGQVESGTTYSTLSTSSLPTGWSGSDGGGTSYIKLTANTHYIQTSEFGQNGFTSIKIKARKFGGPTDAQALITVSWYSNNTETVLGTIAPSSTNLTDYTISSPTNPSGNTTGYIKIQCKGAGSSKGSGVSAVTITYTSSGSTPALETSDLALTGAPVALTFDLYNNSTAKTINYTTSSTGAITIADSDYATFTINQSTKTITVTPVAVTPGAQTITVNQAADDTYAAGSQTFTVNITDSTPFTGGDITFVAGTDVGSSTASGSPDQVTKHVATISSTDAAFATAQYRFYKNSTTTISTSEGVITSIVFTGSDNSYPISNLSTTVGSFSEGSWTGNASSVVFSASAQARATKVVVTVDLDGNPDPEISADNISIAYGTTSGSIAFSVTNPVSGGVVTASTTATWLTLGTVGAGSVPFTCAANTETTARTATVTLTYTYGTNETVTKDVSVTQAASPVIYKTIPALYEAATTSEKDVLVTFSNWVVSGVSSKNVYVTDNSGKGFIIFDNAGGLDEVYSVGDVLSGTAVSCVLLKYKGSAEIKGLDSDDLTITSGGTVTVADVAMADLSGDNTGAVVSYENLTCSVDNSNKYYLSDGTTTLQVYNTLFAFGSLTSGKTYNITGVYQQFDSTKEILPRSADDIVEVVITVPTITVNPATANLAATDVEGTLPITYQNLTISDMTDFDIEFCNADEKVADQPSWVEDVLVAEQDPSVGDGYVVSFTVNANDGEARTAYFRVYALADDATTLVYSNLVTINQAAPVIDYATLPFSYDGNGTGTLPVGFTVSGTGTYNSSPKIKFDSANDYAILKFNETPGTLTFKIKGNGASGDPWAGTFKVQVSTDGVTFTDLAAYTELGDTETKTFDELASDVRYVKWVYVTKTLGNVALGDISLSAYVPESALDTYTLTATLGDGAYWATFYNGSAAYTLSEGAQAFTMNNSKQLYRLGTDGKVIPENTAVVIISDVPTVTLTKTADVGTVTVNGDTNILQGSNAPVAKTGTQYVLGKVDNKIGFYLFNGTNIPANKAYYVNE